MIVADYPFASLNGALIRRRGWDFGAAEPDFEAPAAWRADLRFFGISYLAGFVFFLALIV